MNENKTTEKIESRKIVRALPKIKALKNTRNMNGLAGGVATPVGSAVNTVIINSGP